MDTAGALGTVGDMQLQWAGRRGSPRRSTVLGGSSVAVVALVLGALAWGQSAVSVTAAGPEVVVVAVGVANPEIPAVSSGDRARALVAAEAATPGVSTGVSPTAAVGGTGSPAGVVSVSPPAPVAFPVAGVLAPVVAAGAQGGYSVPVDGGGPGDAAVSALISADFPASAQAAAQAVSRCESGQRSVVSAPNSDGTRDRGIFQLNDGGTLQRLLVESGLPATDLSPALDAQWNVRAAALLFSQRGWQPWTCAAKLGIS